MGPSTNSNFNYAIQFMLGPSASTLVVNVTQGTNILKLSISYLVFVIANTPYMFTQSLFKYYSAPSAVLNGTGFRVAEPDFL